MDEQKKEVVATVQEVVKERFGYWKRVMSDGGEPSSGRWLMFLIAVPVIIIVGAMFWHVLFQVKEKEVLMIWLTAIPALLYALTAWMLSPFGVTKAGSSLSELVNIFKKRDQQ